MAITVRPLASAEIKAAEVAEQFRDLVSAIDRVATGYGIVTTTSSLTVDIQPGAAIIGGKKVGFDADVGNTQVGPLAASNTNHIYLKNDGTFVHNTTGVQPANTVKLYTVVTSGTGVANPLTDITDNRPIAVELATDFVAETVTSEGDLVGEDIKLSGSTPFIRLEDTVTGKIIKIWARNNKLQATNDDGSVIHTDDLANIALIFSAISGTISDAQHGSRGGGNLHANATGGAAGFMSAADKTTLDAATDAATASTIAKRDAAGRLKVVDGAVASDAATKGQVDTVQTNLTNHIGTGGAAHANATGGAAGFMSAADKTKLDAATDAATASTIAMRDAAGRLKVVDGSVASDAATKGQVDSVTTALNNHKAAGGSEHPAAVASGAAGFMSGTDKQKLDDATSAATASKLMMRDASGRAQVAAPSAAADIARKDTVDAVQTNLGTHTADQAAGVHGSTSAATASKLVHRDASGRTKMADPSANDDVDTKGARDTAISAHSASGGSAHPAATGSVAGFMSAADKTKLDAATSAATASALMIRDASGRAKVAAPSASDDIARKAEVDAVKAALTWNSSASTSISASVNNGYITTAGTLATITLPSASVGDIVEVAGDGAGGWKVVAPASTTIQFGNVVSASAGYIASTNQHDTVRLLYKATNKWVVLSAVGVLDVV